MRKIDIDEERFMRGTVRLVKGFAIMLAFLAALFLFGGVVSLCLNYPWVNLLWITPTFFALAWGLGEGESDSW